MEVILFKLVLAAMFGTLAMMVYCGIMTDKLKENKSFATDIVKWVWVTQTITIFIALLVLPKI